MSNGEKLATPKQLAYIERLAVDCRATIATPLGELTVDEASEIIDELLKKVNGGKSKNGAAKRQAFSPNRRPDSWSSGARIGLAFKVCHRSWVRSGVNIFKNKDEFMRNVIATYQLLNEIAEKAEAA
jgi:hypothetical protein